MVMTHKFSALFVALSLSTALVACGGHKAKDGLDPDDDDDAGDMGPGEDEDGGEDVDSDGGDEGDVDAGDESDGGGEGSDGAPQGSCGAQSCGSGQRCDRSAAEPICADNACADLTCSALEECSPVASGGHVCKSIACSSDVQCSTARHCDTGKCVDDVCEAMAQRCQGNQVFQCSSNGSGDVARVSCGGSAYFTSACSESSSGMVGCGCQDDWDCPSFTQCNAGTCQGTGVAPTCTLPAMPFQQVLPKLEFRWGGASSTSKTATGKPFPNSNQVVSTPMVANLNDDNGDGLINELDFPEIVFMTYLGDVHTSGTLRAVHAGGVDRGKDFFAVCGSKRWFEGDDLTMATCNDADGVTRPGGGIAIGDLDYNGVPEIVVSTEGGTVQIFDNRGNLVSESPKAFFAAVTGEDTKWRYPQVGLVNLDNTGMVEIVIGNRVITLEKTAGGVIQALDIFAGTTTGTTTGTSSGSDGTQAGEFGATACPANVIDASPSDDDVSQEIVVGSSLYQMPTAPSGVTRRAQCAGGDMSDFCTGKLTLIWDAQTKNGSTVLTGVPTRDGFCAVADVLGTDTANPPGPSNALDGVPEIVVVSQGRVQIFRASDGTRLRSLDVEAGQGGGAPNIDDFDADGFPEIAMASSGFYTVIDLQAPDATFCPAWNNNLGASVAAPGTNTARNPGGACTSSAQCNTGSVCSPTTKSCVCLHNGWKRVTEDDSSKVTSSSVFDFNGDGAAEVVYGDECYFRIYDGTSGNVQLAVPSVSRTVLENPVVADVDNDGNAEIVFVNNNETLQCSQTTLTNPDGTTVAKTDLPNGIQVWGDASDTWVSARRIWNEHAYHVTNITEGGMVPLKEPESWKPYGNRIYNTYRSQPRAYGVAPDLSLIEMQVSSPDVACGQLSNVLEIVVLVKNLGDLRVGPGVAVTFSGDFGGTVAALNGEDKMPLKSVLTTSLEPGASVLVTVLFRAQDNTQNALPGKVIAVIDEANKERECKEDNNRIEQNVAAGEQLADLKLELGAVKNMCSASTTVAAKVTNTGSLEAKDVLVRVFAGDPSSGGQAMGEKTITDAIAPGQTVTIEVPVETSDRNITVWGIADPLDAIKECNNANNQDEGPRVTCSVILL
jgi:hypothetical protein